MILDEEGRQLYFPSSLGWIETRIFTVCLSLASHLCVHSGCLFTWMWNWIGVNSKVTAMHGNYQHSEKGITFNYRRVFCWFVGWLVWQYYMLCSKGLGKQICQTAWREESFVKAPWSWNLLKSNYWQMHFINIFVCRHIGRIFSSNFDFFLVYFKQM